MLSCSLLDCSLLDCGSVSEAESELSRAGIRVGMWGYRVRGAMLAASVAYSTFSHCFVDVGRLAILLYDEGLHRLKISSSPRWSAMTSASYSMHKRNFQILQFHDTFGEGRQVVVVDPQCI